MLLIFFNFADGRRFGDGGPSTRQRKVQPADVSGQRQGPAGQLLPLLDGVHGGRGPCLHQVQREEDPLQRAGLCCQKRRPLGRVRRVGTSQDLVKSSSRSGEELINIW